MDGVVQPCIYRLYRFGWSTNRRQVSLTIPLFRSERGGKTSLSPGGVEVGAGGGDLKRANIETISIVLCDSPAENSPGKSSNRGAEKQNQNETSLWDIEDMALF